MFLFLLPAFLIGFVLGLLMPTIVLVLLTIIPLAFAIFRFYFRARGSGDLAIALVCISFTVGMWLGTLFAHVTLNWH